MKIKLTGGITLFLAMAMMTSCISKKKYDELEAAKNAEISALNSALADEQSKVEKLNSEAEKLQKNLNMSQEEIASLGEQVKAGNDKISGLHKSIAEAFETYDKNDVTVEERNGKLYVSMTNAILFDSGRAKVAKESGEVLAKLAKAIVDNPGLMIMVEGHTDNEPVKIHRATYKDNWSLSTARALAIVREMQKLGVDGNRLTAVGKGEMEPVASNETDEGRQKNRRTDFVVMPKIDGLYKIYKDNSGGSSR